MASEDADTRILSRPTGSRQAALIEVARQLSSARNVEELLDHILERSREVMDCEVCSILLPHAGTDNLAIRSTRQSDNHEAPVVVPKGKGIAGDVFLNGRPLNIADATKDPRHYTRASETSGLVTRAMLTIPLLEGDRCVGVMQAINPNSIPSFDERDQVLFETFGSLVAVTLQRLAAEQVAIREARALQEMHAASEIQASFLPPTQARIDDLELNAFYEPASQIGGDFYFWHQLDEPHHVLFGIGDVTGKGLPAALDMARATTLIASTAHRCVREGFDAWLNDVNVRLCEFMSAGRFIALNCVLIDLEKRRAQVCVAGLPATMIYDGERWRDSDAPPNPPFGISPAITYRSIEQPVGSMPHVLIYTDGILETRSVAGEETFEDGHFQRALDHIAVSEVSDSPLGQFVDAWREFGGDKPAYLDDATVLIASDAAARPPTDLAFTCRSSSIAEGREFFEAWARFCGFDESTAGLVVLGADEVLTNIAKHAYPCPEGGLAGEGPVTCRARPAPQGLVFTFEHRGKGISNEEFQSLIAPDPPTPEEQIGGLGGHVIREVFDEIDFHTGPEGSLITLTKRWA